MSGGKIPVEVVVERVVGRPAAQVAAFVMDPTNAPRWYANIRTVRWLTPPPVREGSRVAFEARFLTRPLRYEYLVVEHRPGSRLVMRGGGASAMETTYDVVPAGADRARVRLFSEGLDKIEVRP